ncbi:MAG TPA: hypothetical protein VMR21_13260 [Vicinamibacteria bacterium]|nr:hypothetical protein [Vicinamibacteria bacterium]
MREYIRVARLYMIVLAIFTVGRLLMGARGVPYERGHHVFSLVIMTLLASAFYGAFCRKWLGYTVTKAMGLGATLGLLCQVVVLVATVASYALGAETYFVHPRAVMGPDAEGPIPFGQALVSRVGGAVINAALNALAAAIGWVMGATLPEPAARS